MTSPRREFLRTLAILLGGAALPIPALTRAAQHALEPFDVYLTFDDGPTSARDLKTGPTDSVLDTLKERQVAATFFLHGRAINDWEGPTLSRFLTEGHAIGNHQWRQGGNTVKDNPSWALMARQYLEAEVRIRSLLKETSPASYDRYMAQAKLYRRPGGNNGLNEFLKPENLRDIRYEPYVQPFKDQVDWLTDVYDYSGWHVNGGESIPASIRPEGADEELSFILNGGSGYYGIVDYLEPKRSAEADEGLIVLLHDADKDTDTMLSRLIDQLREMGANFRSLPRPIDKPNTKTVGIGYSPTYKS